MQNTHFIFTRQFFQRIHIRQKILCHKADLLSVRPEHFIQHMKIGCFETMLHRIAINILPYQRCYFLARLCHNVLEYALDREEILREFHRLLKPHGIISLVKHNRPGRVMQMVVLLNEFEKADALLNGEDGCASAYGTIHYYEDDDVTKWCEGLHIKETFGIRTFWDLQQKQECHKDPAWQKKMIEVELRVSQIPPYRDIAFFHHLILVKEDV